MEPLGHFSARYLAPQKCDFRLAKVKHRTCIRANIIKFPCQRRTTELSSLTVYRCVCVYLGLKCEIHVFVIVCVSVGEQRAAKTFNNRRQSESVCMCVCQCHCCVCAGFVYCRQTKQTAAPATAQLSSEGNGNCFFCFFCFRCHQSTREYTNMAALHTYTFARTQIRW